MAEGDEGRSALERSADAPESRYKRLLVASGDPAETEALCDWARQRGYFPWPLSEPSREALLFEARVVKIFEWRREFDAWVPALRSSRGATLFLAPSDESVPRENGPSRVKFVTRPCCLSELLGHVSSVASLVWPAGSARGTLEPSEDQNDLRLEPRCDDVMLRGKPLGLRRTERLILGYLMRHSDRFVTTQELQREALGSNGTGAAARNQIYEVRLKLKEAGWAGVLEHVPGKGYRLASTTDK